MSTPFGQTIAPSSGSTKTWAKTAGSFSEWPPGPVAILEAHVSDEAVLEFKVKSVLAQNLHRGDVDEMRAKLAGKDEIVIGGP
jgi:hypothetical protein